MGKWNQRNDPVLTEKQIKLLLALEAGESLEQIAKNRQPPTGVRTIEKALDGIYDKFLVENPQDAIAAARNLNLLGPPLAVSH